VVIAGLTSCPEILVLTDYTVSTPTPLTLNKVTVGLPSAKRATANYTVTLTVLSPLTISQLVINSGSTLDIGNIQIRIQDVVFWENTTLRTPLDKGSLIINGTAKFVDPVRVLIAKPTPTTGTTWKPYDSSGTITGKKPVLLAENTTTSCFSVIQPNDTIIALQPVPCSNTDNSSINNGVSSSNLGWIAAVVIGVLIILAIIIFFVRRQWNNGGISDIPEPPFNVVAISNYVAVDEAQMSLQSGQTYEVIKVDPGQYWFQSWQPNGKLGWFPASYVRIASTSSE